MRPVGKHVHTFAVVADTHMNQSEDYSSSPYSCNKLANARTRYVIAELNELAPDFVVHLGDIVHPVPELPTYDEAAEHFKTLTKDLRAPLHVVPGNHDVGDKLVSEPQVVKKKSHSHDGHAHPHRHGGHGCSHGHGRPWMIGH
jgi:predicted phosphodiesterase